jgi:hypothetical protein
VPHSHIIRLIHHAIRLILYLIRHILYLIRHILYLLTSTCDLILYGIHGSSLVPSHLKLKTDIIGEQGLAALAFGKIEEVYEIEEAHEIEEHYKIEDEVKRERGARFARMGEI